MSTPELLNLKLNDVYDYIKGQDADKRYCPQCGHKTLRNGVRCSRDTNWARYIIWACTHNMQPRTHRGNSHSRKPCDLVLAFNDRDASIDDYGGVLGLLSKIHVPQINQWLLKNDDKIHAKGMEVIYEGPIFDVIRRRHDTSGVGAGLYWKRRTYEQDDETIFDPHYYLFDFARSEAAHYIDYKGFKVAYLFDRKEFVDLWNQDEDEDKSVFKGKRCGKRMQAEIVEFCEGLEVAIPEILKEARDEDLRWQREKREFWHALQDCVPSSRLHMSMSHYCGESRTASLSFPCVRPATAATISSLLLKEIRVVGLTNASKSTISLDEAIKVEQALGVEYRVSLRQLEYPDRYNLDMAKDLAQVIAADPSL